MTQGQSGGRSDAKDVKIATPALQLPDAASTAEMALSNALDYCARKMKLSGASEATEALRRDDVTAGKYFGYGLAKHVGIALSDLDENVKAVYLCDYDATPEDLSFREGVDASPLHMIVWADRITSALVSLVHGLDRALASRWAELLENDRLAHVLDVQVVDDDDVANRSGYGALITSLYNPPLKVWGR